MNTHFIFQFSVKNIEVYKKIKKSSKKYYKKSSNTKESILVDKFIDEIKLANNMQDSTVAINGSNIIDKKIRKSKTMKDLTLKLVHNKVTSNGDFNTSFNVSVKQILPDYYNSINIDSPFYYNKDENKWTFLAYANGGYFKKHTDGKENDDHYGTLLLFPPKKLHKYVGGNLIIHDGLSQHTISYNDLHSTKWTLVGFPINVEHECTPVTSGCRYIFKSKLIIPSKYAKLFSNNIIPKKLTVKNDDVVNDISEVQNKINDLKNKIIEYENEIVTFNNLKPNKDIIKIMEQIDEKDGDIFIVLHRKYDSINPEDLIGNDRILYNTIFDQYSTIKLLQIEKCTANLGDGHEIPKLNSDTLDEIFNSYTLILQKEIFGQYPGEYYDEKDEYNDQTYDTIYTINVTAIHINKNL
jgi:Rps23 Pro-64 3,4-dihydroxylase Tpa1-like proline 4-hydroxylase